MRIINGVVSIPEDVISDTGGVPAQLIRDIANVSKLRLVTLESRSVIVRTVRRDIIAKLSGEDLFQNQI